MTRELRAGIRWLLVVVFAIAMAWLEAATVYYLRLVVGRLEPYQPDPLPIGGVVGRVELAREAATLLMLLLVGALAGRDRRSRIGYVAVAFGVWDIGYYVFLKVICGWPRTILDWDVLFLLPLPWWGPVIAPVAIAALMILWGTLVARGAAASAPPAPGPALYRVGYAGVALALYVFMADAIGAIGPAAGVVREALPARFNWPAFAIALAMMAAPVAYEAARSGGITGRAAR